MLQKGQLKRICICPDDELPVIIKINPCPGKTCPFARESISTFISNESSLSLINFSSSSEETAFEPSPTVSEKVDSSTSTSEGKTSTGTEVFLDYRLVDCPGFEKEGKCVNDAECATSPSLLNLRCAKIVAHKANQIICTHAKLTSDELEKNIEENIMRNQSEVLMQHSLESIDPEAISNQQQSRVSVIVPAQSTQNPE